MSRGCTRPADPADLERLLAIEEDAFSSDRISRRSWRAFLANPCATVLVAESGPDLCGAAVVLARSNSSIARLYSIGVAKDFRGQGIGALLLDAACAAARRRGMSEMRLESRADNLHAHALFISRGFRKSGSPARAYYEDGQDAIRFSAPLDARVSPGPSEIPA